MRTARAVQGLIAHAPGAVQRDRMVQGASERLGLSPAALRRDMARNKPRPAPPAAAPVEAEAPAAPVRRPAEEVELLQMLFHHPEEVFPVVADHLPLDYLNDPDCRLLMELLLDCPAELMENLPEDRPDVLRLAARVQMEETKMRGKDVPPAKAAQDIVMGLWRQALKRRRQQVERGEQSAMITMQLKQLDMGWEHAVGFMVV